MIQWHWHNVLFYFFSLTSVRVMVVVGGTPGPRYPLLVGGTVEDNGMIRYDYERIVNAVTVPRPFRRHTVVACVLLTSYLSEKFCLLLFF
jgi:hypothetical protein